MPIVLRVDVTTVTPAWFEHNYGHAMPNKVRCRLTANRALRSSSVNLGHPITGNERFPSLRPCSIQDSAVRFQSDCRHFGTNRLSVSATEICTRDLGQLERPSLGFWGYPLREDRTLASPLKQYEDERR